jgi:hypothetical protein
MIELQGDYGLVNHELALGGLLGGDFGDVSGEVSAANLKALECGFGEVFGFFEDWGGGGLYAVKLKVQEKLARFTHESAY